MRKADRVVFRDILAEEAKRQGRSMTQAEIDTWFEVLRSFTLADVTQAITDIRAEHRGFPGINELQRALAHARKREPARDNRCAEHAGGLRCMYVATIFPVGEKGLCRAHYRIRGTVPYDEVESLRIIEASGAKATAPTEDDVNTALALAGGEEAA